MNITERKETLHNIMDFGVKFKIFREVFRNYHGLQEAKCNDSNKARHLLRNPQCVIHQTMNIFQAIHWPGSTWGSGLWGNPALQGR